VGPELTEVDRDQWQGAESGEVELLAGSCGVAIAFHARGDVPDGIDGVVWSEKA
jgi:hypothetical protein